MAVVVVTTGDRVADCVHIRGQLTVDPGSRRVAVSTGAGCTREIVIQGHRVKGNLVRVSTRRGLSMFQYVTGHADGVIQCDRARAGGYLNRDRNGDDCNVKGKETGCRRRDV